MKIISEIKSEDITKDLKFYGDTDLDTKVILKLYDISDLMIDILISIRKLKTVVTGRSEKSAKDINEVITNLYEELKEYIGND